MLYAIIKLIIKILYFRNKCRKTVIIFSIPCQSFCCREKTFMGDDNVIRLSLQLIHRFFGIGLSLQFILGLALFRLLLQFVFLVAFYALCLNGRWILIGNRADIHTLNDTIRNGIGFLFDRGEGNAIDVSADGSVIVGSSNYDSGLAEAFRWTAETGMVGLGDLPGGAFSSQALGVSADGSIVVGHGTTAAGREAFIWDATNGMRNLKEVLESDFGLNLTGWTLREPRGPSSDGLVIVGSGTNPIGQEEGWIAELQGAPPCPWDCGDGDGIVGIVDLLKLLSQWGGPGSCDVDGGDVHITDLLELLANWGPCEG